MPTNLGLVEHVLMALKEKWGYMNGTIGQILTEAILQYKIQQWPQENAKYEDFIRKTWMGRRTADCICLIKSYLWWNNGDIKHSPDIDLNVEDTYSAAKVKGPIATMPKTPGICVMYPGHIGVYIGNNKVVEARGTTYGVVETNLNERPWTHWLEYPFILYVNEDNGELRKGDTGEDVRLLQRMLNIFGLALEEDSSFGRLTENALKTFQVSNGIPQTGIVDCLTSKTLVSQILDRFNLLQNEIGRLNTYISKIKLAYVDFGESFKL